MGQYTDSIARFLQYGFKVLPEVHSLTAGIAEGQKLCISQAQSASIANVDAAIPEQPDAAVLCSSFFALYPGADKKSTLLFIILLHSLSKTLEAYRFKKDISCEAEIRRLYGCLSCAVDPSRSAGCPLGNLSKASSDQKKEPVLSLCLSDQCRLQLAFLPSYPLVAPKLKKYMQFYIDLQSYRHYPARIREEYLKTWSNYYLKRYREISCWEFCAASDSLLGIVAMYASAADPNLTPEDIKLLDEACFPWLCGLDSLLHSYIHARFSQIENLNFTSFYENLKLCEERILFFTSKAEEACKKLKESSFYMMLINILTGIYLADSEANFGMYKIASLNILKKCSAQAIVYRNACKLLHFYAG